jgi:hypothetical protein
MATCRRMNRKLTRSKAGRTARIADAALTASGAAPWSLAEESLEYPEEARIYWLAEGRAGCVTAPHAADRSLGERAFQSVRLHPLRSGSHSGGHYAQAVRLRRPTLFPLSYRRADADDSGRAWIELRRPMLYLSHLSTRGATAITLV